MKRFYCIVLTLFFITTGSLQAATVTINFGGALGNAYSPKATQVNVGDVITWMGDFATHPLQSISVPVGALGFGPVNTGTSFSYTVTVAGNYGYQCNVHFLSGMVGGFAAGASGVDQPIDVKLTMDPIFPNPAMAEAMVHFTLENHAHVLLRVFDPTGKLIHTAANEDMDAGFHMLTIDTKEMASGSYQYVLQAGDAVLRRAMIVVK